MSSALEVLDNAQRHGLDIAVTGDRLRLRAARKPPHDLLAAIRQHKSAILALLGGKGDAATAPIPTADTAEIDAFKARAAIIEYDAGVPRGWAEGFARLDGSMPPDGFDARRWRTLIDDGGKFLDRWGAEAARLGWSALDVFGVHPIAPDARYDVAGLLMLIGGGEVISIRRERATIRAHASGSLLTYLRSPRAGGIAFWELVGAT